MVLSTNNAGKASAGPTASQTGLKNQNSSQRGLATTNTASGKHMRSMSLSKRLAMVGGIPPAAVNQTIDLTMLGAPNHFQTLDP